MKKLLIVVGIIWAILGLWNIFLMPWHLWGANALAFGMIFNAVCFILPGLAIAGIGSTIETKTVRRIR